MTILASNSRLAMATLAAPRSGSDQGYYEAKTTFSNSLRIAYWHEKPIPPFHDGFATPWCIRRDDR